MEQITSASNPKIKNLLLLQEKSRARREQGLFVVEGRRELEHCIAAGFKVRTLFYCPDIMEAPSLNSAENYFFGRCPKNQFSASSFLRHPSHGASIIEIPEAVYRKVAYREGTEGVIAEVEAKHIGLEELQLPDNPLIVVLEAVEKPGNLGAVLRSADAAGASAVIVCDPLTDLYNPNLIRASIGAVFTVPVVAASSEETIGFLKERGIQILTAQLQDSSLYYDVDMRGGTAIIMGTESTGLTDAWRQAADAHIRIPMLGSLDSLNVSVSAAILLFEAVRQREGVMVTD
ncbi:MAG: RNA methyltransferase [Bacteroidales bacterium]|nr:RNA methyltransferase [Bacteroidales bacterium]